MPFRLSRSWCGIYTLSNENKCVDRAHYEEFD